MLAGYLHQDWRLEYSTVWDAVRAFRSVEPTVLVAEARRQALELLQSVDPEHELRRILTDELGSGYGLDPDDYLTFGFSSSHAPASRWNYVQLHRSCIADWGEAPHAMVDLEALAGSDRWEGDALERFLGELRALVW